LQWLQNPLTDGDNKNNVGLETRRTFRDKKREYLYEESTSLKQTVRTKPLEAYIET
jgi:hypothetical protein